MADYDSAELLIKARVPEASVLATDIESISTPVPFVVAISPEQAETASHAIHLAALVQVASAVVGLGGRPMATPSSAMSNKGDGECTAASVQTCTA